MRFIPTFLSLQQLILISSVLAIHPFVFSRNRSATRTQIDHLQYRFPRSLIDTCVSLDANAAPSVVGNLPLAGPLLTPLIVSAITNLCLCLKDLDLYLKTDAEIKVLTELLGKDNVVGLLTAIINTSPNSRQCVLPAHAKRSCDTSDPCHWACEDNFTRKGDTCTCTLPKRVCGGICGNFPAGCAALPSSVPRSLREISDTNLAQANTTSNAVIHTSLGYQLTRLFNLAVKLKQDYARISASNATSAIGRHFAWNIVYPVLQNLAGVVTAPQVTSLVANTDNLLDSVTASSRKLADCACVRTLDLDDLVADLNAMLAVTVNLTQWLATKSAATIPNASGDAPVTLDLSGLLNGTGLGGTQTDVVIDGLGASIGALVDLLLDGLRPGPNVSTHPANFDTGLAVNLDALLDLTLRLVLDANECNMSAEIAVLQGYVHDTVEAMGALVASVIHGQSVALELSNLVDLAGTTKSIIEKPSQSQRRMAVIADLDEIVGLLAMVNGQQFSSFESNPNVDLDALLYDLEIKALRLHAVVDNPELATNLGLTLNTTLTKRGL